MKESARLRGRRNGPRPLFGSSFNFCGLNFSIVDRRWHGRSMNIRTGRVPVPSKFWRFLFFFSFLFRAERKVFCFVRWKRIRWMEEILWKSKMKSCFPSSMRFELLYKFCVRFFIHFYFKVWIYMYIYIVRPHQWINASDCRRELRIEFIFFFLSKSSNYIHLGSMRVDKSTASSNYKSRKLLQGLKFSSPKNVKLRTWPGNSDKDRSLSISSLRSRI